MRRHRPAPPAAPSAQIAFDFEEASFPSEQAHQMHESASLPPLPTPGHIPVYTVFLRRSDAFAVRELPAIRTAKDVALLLGDYLKDTDREHFVILLLDVKNVVIGINTVSVGILDSALVHPREVYKAAILANAASLIMAHNHPSGDPTPSPEDRRVTHRICEVGQLLGIEVLDHIVIGDRGRYYSFKEKGVF